MRRGARAAAAGRWCWSATGPRRPDRGDGRGAGRAHHRLPAVPAVGRRRARRPRRGGAVPRDHAGRGGRPVRRRPGHPRGPVHLPAVRADARWSTSASGGRRETGCRSRSARSWPAGPVDPAQAAEWIRASVRPPGPTRRQPRLRARPRPGDGARRGRPAHRALRQRVHRDLGDEGRAAVDTFLGRAAAEGLTCRARPPTRQGDSAQTSSSRATACTTCATSARSLVGEPAPAQVGLHLRLEHLDHVLDQAVQLLGRAAAQLGHGRRRRPAASPAGPGALAALDHAELDPLAALELGPHRRAARSCARRRRRLRHW